MTRISQKASSSSDESGSLTLGPYGRIIILFDFGHGEKKSKDQKNRSKPLKI